MENKLKDEINLAQRKLRTLTQQKDQVESVLLQYQSGVISSHKLYESYHGLTAAINEFSSYIKDFRDSFDTPRTGANKDAVYFQARRLNEQILTQLTKVQDLSNRVKSELNNVQNKTVKMTNNWETFSENHRSDPLVDLNEGSVTLQIEEEDSEQAYNDMRKVENDILKINEMFTTLAGFVHEQGDLTDRIEASVEVAYSQVDSGNEQLAKAVQHKRSARKKKIICVIILVVALLIIGVIIYFSVRN